MPCTIQVCTNSRRPAFCWKWTQRSVLLPLLLLVLLLNTNTIDTTNAFVRLLLMNITVLSTAVIRSHDDEGKYWSPQQTYLSLTHYKNGMWGRLLLQRIEQTKPYNLTHRTRRCLVGHWETRQAVSHFAAWTGSFAA